LEKLAKPEMKKLLLPREGLKAKWRFILTPEVKIRSIHPWPGEGWKL
jgi:hypothetical protein